MLQDGPADPLYSLCEVSPDQGWNFRATEKRVAWHVNRLKDTWDCQTSLCFARIRL